jgi:uncharacterized protein (DUF1501 family)
MDLERGLSALIEDLDERGLLDSTIVVVCSEFGRTPKIQNAENGRNHWAKAFTTVVAGGPFKRGFVYGETDKGHEPKTPRTSVVDFHTTLGTALGIPVKKVVMSSSGRPFNVGHKGKVIKDVLA